MHYTRKARYGDPLIATLSDRPRGYVRAILEEAAASNTDECVIFTPISDNDARTVTLNGKGMNAARAVWILRYGEIPSGGHILHRCNKGGGGSGCINPRHLYLGTSADNARDTLHAGRRFWARLTPEDVLEIRRVGVVGQHHGNVLELADRYGVKPRTIRNVLNRRTWTTL